jgi:hypothetical protein
MMQKLRLNCKNLSLDLGPKSTGKKTNIEHRATINEIHVNFGKLR